MRTSPPETRTTTRPLLEAIVGPLGKLIDKIIPDPRARDAAKLELLKLQGDQDAAQIAQQMQAIIAEANKLTAKEIKFEETPAEFMAILNMMKGCFSIFVTDILNRTA